MKIYYGRVSTSEQNIQSQQADAISQGCELMFFDEGVSGYHVAPENRPEWSRASAALRAGDILVVRWLDRISRRYDELSRVMRMLMDKGIRVECTMNGMVFDGASTDPIAKATRDAVLAFMAAQGEVDYMNRREMQKRGIESAKADGRHLGRPQKVDAQAVVEWRAETGASIKDTAEHFGISTASVKRACKAAPV